MRQILLTTIGVLGLAVSSAWAADMPARAPLVKAPTPAPVAPLWSGFYLGVNAGYGWSNHLDSAIGGGQVGYNWQLGQFVLGAEGDVQAFGLSGTATTTNAAGTASIRETMSTDYLATLRGRLGVAFGQFLVYGTGGAAFTTFNHDGAGVTGVTGTYSASNDKVGWTAGGGVEWMPWPHWSVKVEYLYADFSGYTNTYLSTTPPLRVSYHDAHINMIRAGLNYHF